MKHRERATSAVQFKPTDGLSFRHADGRCIVVQKHAAQAIERKAAPPLYYAHEGCFLAFPDIGYDSEASPFVNAEALGRDAALLEREIEGAAAMGCAGFVQLMSAVDDFVAYEWLDHPERQRRQARAEALAEIQARLVRRAHALGMKYYVQTYELLLDRWVAARATTNGIVDLLEAKYGEFFRRTEVDGLFVTPSEAHPRGTVIWCDLWGGKSGVARMAQNFHTAIVERLGRELVFRLWLAAETEADWTRLQAALPAGLPLCVKNTATDFWNRVPLNPALHHGGAGHPLHVIFDIFGQYHGWGKLLYFDSLWEPSLAACAHIGATVQMWGSWVPSCIWPNQAPHDLTTAEPVAWAGSGLGAGLWESDHLGGQLAMLWLVARAGGTPAEAAVHAAAAAAGLGARDASAIQEAVPVIQRLWDEMYTVHRGKLVPLLHQWSSIYQSPRKTWRDLLGDGGRDAVRESNARMETDGNVLQQIGYAVTNPELHRVWERTCLYFQTFRWAREAACQDPRFAGGGGVSGAVVARLKECLRRWEAFPDEGHDWFLTGVSTSRFPARKRWLRDETLARYVANIESGRLDPVPDDPAWTMETWNGR